jgi:hypothetical protein
MPYWKYIYINFIRLLDVRRTKPLLEIFAQLTVTCVSLSLVGLVFSVILCCNADYSTC